MALLIFIFVFVLALSALGSHFVSTQVYKRQVKAGNRSATTIRVVTFIFSFLLIWAIIYYILISSFAFRR
jgi:hypothetical protein